MKYPDPAAYSQAIQSPKRAFSDACLQSCEVEVDKWAMPKVRTGNFACTFHLSAGVTQDWAVRCFLRDMADLQPRYAALAALVSPSGFNPFVRAFYREQGIRVDGAWYPITQMEWIKGVPLTDHIDRNRLNPAALEWLPEAFLKLARYLDAAGVAHGDLSDKNILAVNRELKLVDYDSMWISTCPSLASEIVGQPDFQHPSRTAADIGPNIDHFSEIVIYLGLLATAENPSLWSKYADGDNILFKRADFLDPDKSSLLAEMARLPLSGRHVANFKKLCNLPIGSIPSLLDFLGGRLPAASSATYHISIAKFTPAYDVLRATNTSGLLARVGQRVTVVGKSTNVCRGVTKTAGRLPYVFVNFHNGSKRCFGLTFWAEGLQTLANSGRTPDDLAPQWLSVTGVITVYKGQPYIVDPLPSEIRVLSGAEEASLLLSHARESGSTRVPPQTAPAPSKQPLWWLPASPLQATSKDAVTYVNEGLKLARAGEYSAAAQSYKTAICLDPDMASAYYHYACLEAASNRPAPAINLLRQAIDRDPRLRGMAIKDPEFVQLLGNAEFRTLVGLEPLRGWQAAASTSQPSLTSGSPLAPTQPQGPPGSVAPIAPGGAQAVGASQHVAPAVVQQAAAPALQRSASSGGQPIKGQTQLSPSAPAGPRGSLVTSVSQTATPATGAQTSTPTAQSKMPSHTQLVAGSQASSGTGGTPVPLPHVSPAQQLGNQNAGGRRWLAASLGGLAIFGLLALTLSLQPLQQGVVPSPTSEPTLSANATSTPLPPLPSPSRSSTPIPPTPSPSVTSIPPTVTLSPTPVTLYVGNTNGDGVYLRSAPDRSARMTVYWDCTKVIGYYRVYSNSEWWYRVLTPDGSEGWIPEKFLVAKGCD